jgi:hypothetical protein
MGLTTPAIRNKLVMKCHKGFETWADYLDKQPKLRKMHMRLGIWNVTSDKGRLLRTVAEETSKYRLRLVGV